MRHRLAVVPVRAAVVAPQVSQKTRAKPALINGIIFRQLIDADSSTYTFLLACPQTHEAILIDPVYEQVDRDLEIVDDLGVKLLLAANTHAHADHITGSGKLKALRPGMCSAIAAASGAAGDIQLSDGDTLTVGSLHIKCLSTPGHTNGCMSFYLPPVQPDTAGMVFTGDALLIKGCGRTDFQQGNAGLLYDNIHSQLFTLPEDTLVLPGHDYKGRCMSSIGAEKSCNPRLTKTRQEFINLMHNLNLPHPKQISRALPANMKDGADFPYA
jgi:sulfur dioxygenase